MTHSRLYLVFALLITLSFGVPAGPAVAQSPQQQADAGTLMNPTVKEYGRAGYPKITVYVWGNADSGVWNVEKGTDLLEFVSVVSRIRMVENDPDRRPIRTLRLYRDQSPEGDEDPFFETRIETLFGDRSNYPSLKENDILVLETEARNRFTWRDIARVTGTVAAVLNTYLLIDRFNEN
jgi:hypothetical protein